MSPIGVVDYSEARTAFTADLKQLSTKHIQFLQGLHSLGVSLSTPSSESLRRYIDLWLPLVYEIATSKKSERSLRSNTLAIRLIPSADVAWLWHCHRLAPFRYTAYCRHRFGPECPILEADPPFTFQSKGDDDSIVSQDDDEKDDPNDGDEASDRSNPYKTRDLWSRRYPEQSFYFEDVKKICENGERKEYHFLGFDLVGSTERQMTFLWQVSGPRFSDDDFLAEGVRNYYKFLLLRQHASSEHRIVPTYQIDLMWHTHILANMRGYYNDCNKIIGQTLHHDDSLNDRTEGGELDQLSQYTRKLWESQYGESFTVPGGMYRGEPPEAFFRPEWVDSFQHDSVPCIGPFLHAIHIQGATSTNPTLIAWTSVNGFTPDGTKPAFILATTRSTTKGVNSNVFKPDYIFGQGPRGLGYYHVTTREAYAILDRRIDAKLEKLRMDLACMKCCLFGHMRTARIEAKMNDIDNLDRVLVVVRERSKAPSPMEVKDIPRDLRKDKNSKAFHDPIFYSAGGCGASGSAWGGCGGCGAGACGGGGCGGGAGCGGCGGS